MPLDTGSLLGPYEIVSMIGAGGMGEVYRARDRRLGRTVAVKVLPPQQSVRAELRERFEREARVISSLSHPHICALYDIGHQDGIDYLVMEYLEGESLAVRLERGPLPFDQLLRTGIQIAEALDQAHRQGVVHRDLKPGNIMMTRTGAKLLDFGLAKLRPPDSQHLLSSLHSITTVARNLSVAGAIVGTVQYMAPEQLEGKEADGRADIFAFGAVLYEMATAKKAFEGETYASIIAAIMSSNPAPVSEMMKISPPALDRLVSKCLAKDPEDRWQSAHDLASELRWISEGGSSAAAMLSEIRHPLRRLRQILPAVALAALALLVVFLYQSRKVPPTSPPWKLSVIHAPQAVAAGPLAFSPDGTRLAIVGTAIDGIRSLWVRQQDSLTPKLLPGTEDATYPFWSPDGRFLAYFTQDKLKRIEVGGGPPQLLADAPGGKGGTWNRDGIVLMTPTFTGGIFQMSVAGGKPSPLTRLDEAKQESSHRWPWFLPDGKHFLYVILAAKRENCGLFVGSLEDPELKKQILQDYSRAEYAPSGHLVFVRGRTLVAQQFDLDQLELKGDVYSLGEKAGYDGYSAYGAFSATGNHLAFGMLDEPKKHVVLRDRDGKELGAHGLPADYREPVLSPDEKRLVVEKRDPNTDNNDLWILDLSRGTFTRLSFDPSNEVAPLWSPDGKSIVYCSNPRGLINIYRKDVSGSGSAELLVDTPNPKYPNDWSRDGNLILYEELSKKTKFDLWYFSPHGDRKPQPFQQTNFNETHSKFSADGRWVAYTSDETGRAEVYVRRFPPDAKGKWQISTNGGDQAFWRNDGAELYYISPDRKLMAVSLIFGSSELTAGVPAPLMDAIVDPNTLVEDRNQYASFGDGKRFVVIERVAKAEGSPVSVVLNWPALLR